MPSLDIAMLVFLAVVAVTALGWFMYVTLKDDDEK